MFFRRSGHLEDRRRRLLSEESAQAPTATAARTTPTANAPARPTGDSGAATSERRRPAVERKASAGASVQRTLRLGELVPRRWSRVTMALVATAAWLALLLAVHHFGPRGLARWTDGAVAFPEALYLDAFGSLARFSYSLAMIAAAVIAHVIYSIRRHKVDDYRGRYRVWIWAAVGWLVLAIDKSTGLHTFARDLLVHFSGRTLWGDGSLWWLSAYGVYFGTVGLRMLLDLRGSRLATVTLLTGFSALLGAAVLQLGLVHLPQSVDAILVEEGLELGACWTLLWAMLLQARYVMLDAEGLIAARPRREKPRRKAEPAGDTTRTRPTPAATGSTASREPASSGVPRPLGSGRPERTTTAVLNRASLASRDEEDDEEVDEDSPRHRLSKAERKALRRQQRQSRRDDYDDD